MATVTTNTYVGVWNPNSGSLPTIKSGIQFAQYFVTDSGSSSDLGISFDNGDWLIYLVDDSNVGHWYKTSAGVVTVSTIGSNNGNAPAADWYTKVYVNAAGKISDAKSIEADYLPKHTHSISDIPDLTNALWPVVKSTFQNQKLGNVKFDIDDSLQKITAHIVTDEETIDTNEHGQLYAIGGAGTGETVPSDIVTKDQITGFISKDTLETSIWPIIEKVFQNQKLGNVKFSVDEVTHKITASVVVDEETINTNELGQLYSIVKDTSGTQIDLSNASFTISQVVNLESELTAIKKSIASASTSGIVDVSDIPIDESTIIIDSNGNLAAVAQKNQPHTHVMNDISNLPQQYAAVAATKQTIESDTQDMDNGYFKLKNQKLDYAISSINKYLSTITDTLEVLGRKAGKIVPIEPKGVTSEFSFKINNDTVQAYNKIDKKVETCFYGGNISITSLDGVYPYNSGTVLIYLDGSPVESLSLSDMNAETAVGSVGNFSYSIKDAYTDKNYTGFYYNLYFSWSYKDTLSNGEHTLSVKHKLADGTVLSSSPLTFGVVNSINGLIDDAVSIKESYTINDSFTSGIPKCTSDNIVNTLVYDIQYTGTYVPMNFITSDEGTTISTAYNNESITGTIKEYFKKENGKKVTSIKLTDFNGTTIYDKMFASPYLRFDTSSFEEYRVILDGDTFYPYDSKNLLPDGNLVIVNGMVSSLNNQSYTLYGGPDYSSLQKVKEHGDDFREIILRFTCTKFINNFFMNIENAGGAAFESEYNGTLKGIIVDSWITNSSTVKKWLSSITSYNGYSSYDDSDFGTLDLFRSTAKKKYFTFGRTPTFNLGYLYVKILLKDGYTLNTNIAIASIIESLAEQGNYNE